MQRERQTQKGVVTLLKTVFPFPIEVIKIDNEGRKEKAKNTVAEGFRKGASDLLLVFPAKYYPSVVFLEMKTQKLRKTKKGFSVDTTNQSPEQIEFQQSIEALGQHYQLCTNIDEAVEFVNWWCNKNNVSSRLSMFHVKP
jgi:hypothetical protein